MTITETDLSGVLLIEPSVFSDERGYFMEIWNENRYRHSDLHISFVQDNISCSERGVLRGLHFQNPSPQGKLVAVLDGEVFDVAVDLRRDSKTFGKWTGIYLSSSNKRQLYIPEGFAHGFVVTSHSALFLYKCTDFYSPRGDRAIRWDDPDLGIEWPILDPILSSKDATAPLLSNTPEEWLF